MWYKV